MFLIIILPNSDKHPCCFCRNLRVNVKALVSGSISPFLEMFSLRCSKRALRQRCSGVITIRYYLALRKVFITEQSNGDLRWGYDHIVPTCVQRHVLFKRHLISWYAEFDSPQRIAEPVPVFEAIGRIRIVRSNPSLPIFAAYRFNVPTRSPQIAKCYRDSFKISLSVQFQVLIQCYKIPGRIIISASIAFSVPT